SRGSVRYRILETVRQYGHDRLAQAGELDQLSSRHALYFVDLVEQTQPDVPGSTQEIETLDRYERDYSNLRAALRWTIDRKNAEWSARLIVGLYRLWYLRGNLSEGRRWFEQVLVLELDSHSRTTAQALRGAGLIAYAEGDYVGARGHTECAL